MGLSTLTTEQFTTESSTTQQIAVGFPFASASDLVVEDVNRIPSLRLVLNTDYSVSGGGLLSAGGYDTGSTTLIDSGAHDVGSVIRVSRRTALQQSRSYDAHGDFPAKAHEGSLDYAMMVAQDQQREAATLIEVVRIGSADADLAVGASQGFWICPYLTFLLYDIAIRVPNTAGLRPTGSSLIVSATLNGGSFFATDPEIETGEASNATSATPGEINPGFSWPQIITQGANMIFSIEQVGSSTPGRALSIELYGKRRISLHHPDPV